ncbi:MAG: cytochrome c maturation protein CcmE [Chloroflexi bacterium]|nr:cytochrome c maturation protein CcmE [Chloroflexota bacterium]
MKKRKFIIAAMIVLVALVYLGYKGFTASATYYYEVSEFLGQRDLQSDKKVKVSGKVVEGTIDRQVTNLKFTISDGKASLPVQYKGTIPDSFKADAEAVVEGKLNSAGVFEATTLLAKCPSKYEPAPAGASSPGGMN